MYSPNVLRYTFFQKDNIKGCFIRENITHGYRAVRLQYVRIRRYLAVHTMKVTKFKIRKQEIHNKYVSFVKMVQP